MTRESTGTRDDDDFEDDDVDARTMVTPVTTTRDSTRVDSTMNRRGGTSRAIARGTATVTTGRGRDEGGGGGARAAATGRKRRRREEKEKDGEEREEERRRSRGGPLFAMGDLKTTPMQTPRESCPPSTGAFNIAKRRSMSASAGRGRARRRDSYNDAFDLSLIHI